MLRTRGCTWTRAKVIYLECWGLLCLCGERVGWGHWPGCEDDPAPLGTGKQRVDRGPWGLCGPVLLRPLSGPWSWPFAPSPLHPFPCVPTLFPSSHHSQQSPRQSHIQTPPWINRFSRKAASGSGTRSPRVIQGQPPDRPPL